MTSYLPREIHQAVARAMRGMPVVVITGPRQSGKSTFLKKDPLFKDAQYYDLDDFETLDAMRQNPGPLLEKKQCIIIDEIQRAPDLFIAVKHAVDKNRRPGRFVLSGSANLSLLGKVSESLAGRAIYLDMLPMTLREIKRQIRREPFIENLLKERRVTAEGLYKPLAETEVLLGGMPSVCLGRMKDPSVWFAGYLQTYLEKDVRDLSRITNLILFRNFLQLTALRTGQLLSQSELARDAKMDAVKAGRYLSLLEASFVISRLRPHLRNKSSRIIKSPKLISQVSADMKISRMIQ
jgi:predicted AAA+ superfamily ATPase